MKLSIVIPVFNEKENIEPLIERVKAVVLPGNLEKEIIIVDDGSTDGTREILEKYRSEDIFKIHVSMVNFGKGAAVRVGIKYATGDLVLIQDADLEYRPEDYPRLLEPILHGETDVVYGSRFLGKIEKMSSVNFVGNRLLAIVNRLLFGVNLSDPYTCFKVMRRSILEEINLRCHGFELEAELTAKVEKKKHRIVEVPISYTARDAAAGKKIRRLDGFIGVLTFLRYRFFDR